MSPRPRKVTDEQVFAAAQRAMGRVGPDALTLADIAGEAGVTPGALAQRFGSKRGLMLALAAAGAAGTGPFLDALRARHDSPLAALGEYAVCLAHLAPSADALARNLAYLQNDLADPELRAHLVTQARATRAMLRRLLREAVAAGELAPDTDARALARTVEVVLNGALFTWAVEPEGTAERWLEANVQAVLAPHRAPAARTRRPRGRRG